MYISKATKKYEKVDEINLNNIKSCLDICYFKVCMFEIQIEKEK